MKRMITLILAVVMAFAMVACGEKTPAAAEKTPLAGTMEENALKIIELCPVEFMGGTMPVDLTDADAVRYYTGLQSAENITEAVAYESMMSAHAFSLVLVRVAEGADAKEVAQQMNDNIDTSKWICVTAEDKLVAGYSDTVMLIMVDPQLNLQAQPFVDAFQQICGAELDFTI